jgi:hypothetical protein
MAEKMMDWKLDDTQTVLTLTAGELTATFDMSEVYLTGDWSELEEVEKLLFINGFKQKVVDKVAGMKDYTLAEKFQTVLDTAKRLTVERLYKAPSEGSGVGLPAHDRALKEFPGLEEQIDAQIAVATKARNKAAVTMFEGFKAQLMVNGKTKEQWLAVKATYVKPVKKQTILRKKN